MPNYQPFIGFTYNGEHSIEDLHIYRTSNSNRYDDNLTATMTDKVVDVPGGDGQYYFGTTFKNRTFTVPFAFDGLEKSDIAKMKRVFAGDGIHELIFDEDRDAEGKALKIWSAKVTGTATMKHLCFEENGRDVYKGEGSITFTCYYPYARSEKIIVKDQTNSDGTLPTNHGDLPAPITLDFSYSNSSTSTQTIYGLSLYLGYDEVFKKIKFTNPIIIPPYQIIRCIWDSNLGIIYEIKNNTKIIIPALDAIMKIPLRGYIGRYGKPPLKIWTNADGSESEDTLLNQGPDDATEFRELYR